MIGLDTETVQGKAWLVCTPDPHKVWFGPNGASTGLWEALLAWDNEYVCYNLTYDVQALLLHTSDETLWRLERLGKAHWQDIDYEWIRGKRLVIKHNGHTSTLYDCAQFYHCSLDNAASKHLGERKDILPAHIDVKNLAPALLDPALRCVVETYCRRDAWLCQRLYELIESGLARCGVTGKPISAAYLAGRYFLSGKKAAPVRMNTIAEPAYYGGRIEMFARGLYAAPVYAYDIRSAYPTQAMSLYDPRSLRLKAGPTAHADAKLGIYHVEVEQDQGGEFGMLPVRKTGWLTYPVGTWRAWVDKRTLDFLQRRAHHVEVLEAIEYLSTYRKPGAILFPQIPQLYLAREEPELKQAVKLLLNGLYGKLAQMDERWEEVTDPTLATLEEYGIYLARSESEGPYRDLFLAAHITGGARVQLTEALLDAPRHTVLQVATDSIYSTVPRPELQQGKALGQWSCEIYHGWLGIMSGVYATKDAETGKWHSMSRGFATKESLPEVLEACPRGSIVAQMTCKVPLTALWALKTGRQVNDIATWKRSLMLNADRKRYWKCQTDAQKLMRGLQWSEPLLYEECIHG